MLKKALCVVCLLLAGCATLPGYPDIRAYGTRAIEDVPDHILVGRYEPIRSALQRPCASREPNNFATCREIWLGRNTIEVIFGDNDAVMGQP